MNLKILNSREIKPLLHFVKEMFGVDFKEDVAFIESAKSKIYIVDKSISQIPLDELRINSMGLYFAEKSKQGYRLSMEGAHIIGKNAKKNLLDLSEDEAKWWLSGLDLDRNEPEGWYILRFQDKILGSGKAYSGQIRNFVPKIRRLPL